MPMAEGRMDVWRRSPNVLCVRLDSIGDVLMTTPAIRALKEQLPERRVTLLTSETGAAVARYIPEIDDVLTYDAPWLKATASRADSTPELRMIDLLREREFDAAMVFTVYSQNPLPSSMLCYLADIPLRLAHCRENPYQLLTDWVADPEPDRCIRHEVQRQLDLVRQVGCEIQDRRLSFRVPPEARERIAGLLREAGANHEQMIVVHPGATAPSRRYPVDQFAQVVRTLARAGWRIVLTGSDAEREITRELAASLGTGAVDLAGCLDLGDMAALLETAPLLIANNTGPVHIAAAVGTPVVDLYALTNPQHTPWLVPSRVLYHDVPCKYCYKSVCPLGHQNCLRLVPPEQVVEAALALLDETADHRHGAEVAHSGPLSV
jgi:lipopolysaccharide heptosyltransferase II